MKSLAELALIREKALKKFTLKDNEMRILVGLATCGIAAGATPVYKSINDAVKSAGIEDRIAVVQTGCIGICQFEPVVEVYEGSKEKVTYVGMTPEKIQKVFEQHIMGGRIVEEYTIGAPRV